MKAPEKLYYIGDDSLVLDPFPVLYQKTKKKYDNEVEYIRKDAFIEKACEYLRLNRDNVETEDNGIAGWIGETFIENFKNYMKGE